MLEKNFITDNSFEEILSKESGVLSSLNFKKTDYKAFEKEYISIIKSVDGFNPAQEKNKSKVAEVQKKMTNLIEKWGLGTVVLFNEHYFKLIKDLNTFEKREALYKKNAEMRKEFKELYEKEELYRPESVINFNFRNQEIRFNFPSWQNQYKDQLKELNLPQQKALFISMVFVGGREKYKFNSNYCDLINQKKLGDCDTFSLLYIDLLSSLKDKNSKDVFEDKSFSVLKTDNHARFSLKNAIVETTALYIVTPYNDPDKAIKYDKGNFCYAVPLGIMGEGNGAVNIITNFDKSLVNFKFCFALKGNTSHKLLEKNFTQAYINAVIDALENNNIKKAYEKANESDNISLILKVEGHIADKFNSFLRQDKTYEAYKLAKIAEDSNINVYDCINFLNKLPLDVKMEFDIQYFMESSSPEKSNNITLPAIKKTNQNSPKK